MLRHHALRALRSRNYRVFFTGQAVSLVGSWMSITATAWLAYDLTGNAFILGLVAFASNIPTLALAPFAGVWVDRLDRRRFLLATQSAALVLTLLLAALAFTGAISVGVLLAISLAKGLVNAFDLPLRQATTALLIDDRTQLPSAIALNSTMFNLARISGPAFAGIVIDLSSPAWCFVIDALTFLAVLVSIRGLQLGSPGNASRGRHAWTQFREGIAYVRSHPPLATLLGLVPFVSLIGFTPGILAPLFARDIYHGSASTQGLLTSAFGTGALTAALFLAGRATPRHLGRVIVRGGLLLASGLTLFAWIHWIPAGLLGFAAAGAGAVLCMASANTLLQSMVDDDKRGRVMGLFTMGQGMFPIGALLIGSLASAIGASATVQVAGAGCLLLALCFLRRLPSWEPQAWHLMDRAASQVPAIPTLPAPPTAT